jgi:hypothetical protein
MRDSLQGSGILTASEPGKHALGLWLYSPDEQRAVELTPLEADRQFFATRFNFDDVALTMRTTLAPHLRSSERIGQQTA